MNDLISRQAAIDALKSAKGKDPFGRYDLQNIGLDWGVSAIEKLPPVQPKRGRWERHYTRPGVYKDLFYYCTACGAKANTKTDYCPSCGAQMEKGEDDD